jgi:hypothetical protein
MMSMLGLVVSKFLFIGIAAIWKLQTRAGASALSSLATYVLALPAFLVIGFTWYDLSDITFSFAYLAYLLAWAIPVIVYSAAIIFLYKYQSLTEQDVYKFATGTCIGVLLDVFVLQTNFAYATVLTITLFFISGWLLTRNRKIETAGLTMPYIIAIIFGISLFEALDFFLYKQAIALQGNPLLHIIIAQILLVGAFTLIGGRALIRHLQSGAIKLWHLLAIPALFVPAVVLEGLAIAELPISLMITSSIVSVVMLMAIDAYNKEIRLTPESWLALILVVIGIVLTQVPALW